MVLALSILVGILDGFGLAMFIPLLEFVANDGGGQLSHTLDGCLLTQ